MIDITMIQQSSPLRRSLLLISDIALTLLAFHLAKTLYVTRIGGVEGVAGRGPSWLLYPVVALFWIFASLILSVYDPRRTYQAKDQLPAVVGAIGLVGLFFSSIAFLIFTELPRSLVISFLVLDLVFLLSFRIMLHWLLRLVPESSQKARPRSLMSDIGRAGKQMARSFQVADLVAVLALCLGLFWLFFIRSFGLAFTPDSIQYMTYAIKMYYTAEFPVTPFWPPMYPVLINLSMFANGFPAEAAGLLSGLTMVLFLFVFTLILRNYSRDIILIGLFLLALFMFDRFLHSYKFALSEALFSLFLLLNFYSVMKHYETKQLKYYVLAALFTSLAALTRYMGYGLIVTFFAYTLYFLHVNREDKTVSARKYILWNSLSYIPSLLYLMRNYAIWQTFHGPRVRPFRTLFYNLEQTLKVIGRETNLFLLALLVLALILFIFLVKTGGQTEKNRYVLPLAYIAFFVGLYLVILLYMIAQNAVVKIQTRYFSPIYFYLFLFVFISFQGALHRRIEDNQLEQIYTAVLQVAVYGLTIAALFVQVRYFGEFLDEIARKQHERASHIDAGYNASLTSDEFQRFFKNLVTNQDELYVSVVAFQGPHRASAFFFREVLLDDPAFTKFSFEDIRSTFPFWDGDILQGTDFTLAFRANGQDKSIFYRDLPLLETDEQLIDEVRRILTEEDNIDSLWLIVYENEELLTVGRNLAEVLPEGLQIRSQEVIIPYTVYEFALER
ncbi:MAG: hypothetical protein GTO24_04150 [candidate division Zixibacteria bacterium]|nr:hypothetical protein [candidate division Zixibacteria bacterium]